MNEATHRQKKAIGFLREHGKMVLSDYLSLLQGIAEKNRMQILKRYGIKESYKAAGEKKAGIMYGHNLSDIFSVRAV